MTIGPCACGRDSSARRCCPISYRYLKWRMLPSRVRYRKVRLTVQEISYVSQSVLSSAHIKFAKGATSKISPVLDSFNAESCQEGAALDNPERCPLNDRLPDKANVSGKCAFTTFAGHIRITDS